MFIVYSQLGLNIISSIHAKSKYDLKFFEKMDIFPNTNLLETQKLFCSKTNELTWRLLLNV